MLFFKNGTWNTLIEKKSFPAGFLITGVIPLGEDSILFTTLKNGIFLYNDHTLSPWGAKSLQSVASQQIYTATLIDSEHIALGTSLGGCVIIDREGGPGAKLFKA